ncbi:energy transducer TonB [Humidesulfovibrio sp.]
MSGECAINDTEALHPASGSLPKGGASAPSRARLRVPCTARTVRVRTLAMAFSLVAHLLILGILAGANLAVELPAPEPLIEIDMVELPGAKGGGNGGGDAAPVRAAAGVQTPAAVALPSPTAPPAPKPAPKAEQRPQSVPPTTTLAASATATTGSTGAFATGPATGSGGGPGNGSGGGSGGGAGTGVGSGTGQGGVAVDRMPVALRRIKPSYPMSARRRGITGQVLLRIFVDAEGGVREVQVQTAEPPGVFEEKAVEAARKWRFEPALHKGAPVGVWMALPVRFALEQ